MAGVAPTQPPTEGAQLTKPADWAHFMVTAALKFASDDKTRTTYATADEARLEILDTLNWYEAHIEYEWPNFSLMGFDFNQSMRFRRALVGDVFTSLQKSGNVKIGARAEDFGTPDSERERAGKRGARDNRSMAERKRHCKREDNSDTNVTSEDSDKPWWHDQTLLTEAMHDLICRADADIGSYLRGEKSPDALADIVHDGLVSVWDGPVASHDLVPEALEKRRLAWLQGREPSVELGDRPREQRDARRKSTSRDR